MGGFNPQPMKTMDGSIRELEKLVNRYKKDEAELKKTVKLFKAELKKLKKKRG